MIPAPASNISFRQIGPHTKLTQNLQPLDPSPCSFQAAACLHVAGTGETTTSHVPLTLVVSCNFLLIQETGKSTERTFFLLQFRSYIYVSLGAVIKAPGCCGAKQTKNSYEQRLKQHTDTLPI